MVGIQAQNLYLANYLSKLEFLLSRAKMRSKRQAKDNRKKLAKVAKALKIPQDDVNRYLSSKVLQVGDTLDSRVRQLGVERDVRNGLGVQP